MNKVQIEILSTLLYNSQVACKELKSLRKEISRNARDSHACYREVIDKLEDAMQLLNNKLEEKDILHKELEEACEEAATHY